MTNKAFHVTAAFALAAAASSPALGARLRLPPARTPAGSIYSPVAIASELAKRGYRIDKMKRKGTAYAVTATGPHGNRVQMLVDGRSGDIVGLTVLQAAANLVDAVAQAMKSGKNARYYDDTRPFGIIVPDRYQLQWTMITPKDWTPRRGAARYVAAPNTARGYRYAVPYRTVRPAVGGGTRSIYSPQQLSRPLYEVYDAGGARMDSLDAREDPLVLSEISSEETRYSAQEQTFETSYEETYFGSDVDEASIEQTYDYDAEDGDNNFADSPGEGYDSEVQNGDLDEYQATVDDDDQDNDGMLDEDDTDDDNDGTIDSQDNDDDNDGTIDSQDDDDSGDYTDDSTSGDDDQVDDTDDDSDPGDDGGDDDGGDDDGGDDGGDDDPGR